MDYVYDTAGRRTSTTVSNANGIVSKTSYTYDVAGNITALRNRKADDTLLSEFIYTYDAEGNVLSEYDSTTGKTTRYSYDILGRLVSEIGGGTSRYYTYDAAGNRIKAIVDTANTIQYTYDSDGRLTSETQTIGQTSTVINYTYDANGNLIKKKEGTKSTTYAFDVWGNMISAAGASYTYNAQGLRISKTVNKKKTSFTLVGGKVWSDGTYNYVWGAELITNGSVYYLYNAHGDVVQLLNSSGTVTKTYDYEAYGNELKRDAADPNPFRYCGEYYDVETGFIYLRARYYDPSVGRFISKDPAKDGLNWYVYANNNPLVFVDPSGLKSKKGGGIFDPLTWVKGYLVDIASRKQRRRRSSDFFMSGTSLYKNSKIPTRSKRPEPSHASLFALINRKYNRQLDKDNDPTFNQYVNGQGRSQYKDYMNGVAFAGYNGCEAIAIHNARVALGYESSLKQVIWDIDEADAYIWGGLGGANPYALGRVLGSYGMDYEYINDIADMNENGVYIISYWFKGIHTVMVTSTNGRYKEYNSYNYATDSMPFTPSSYEKRFICGYYLGQ